MTEYERFMRLGVDGEAIGFAPARSRAAISARRWARTRWAGTSRACTFAA